MSETMTDTSTMTEIGLGMSNFDHRIDDGFEEALRAQPNQVYGRHSAWNFNGLVWFDGEQFVEQVWVYQTPRTEFKAATLRDLMEDVNHEYGQQ